MTTTNDNEQQHKARSPHFARYILIGFLTVAPLWVTWLVFDFLLNLLARIGDPLLRATASAVRPFSDTTASWLLDSTFQNAVAALITVVCLYGIGLLASFVIGKKLIGFYENILARLPLVQTIYGATKRFLHTLSQPPVTGQRVVLISFPSSEMKAVGFITKVMYDKQTGRQLAAVYVPTSPNPTSGYIEILPMDDVILTDWTTEQAMTFVVTGGTNAPESLHFTHPSRSHETQ
ncbi:MAG: DUF502 domain-containing protein [Nitrosomonas sp.]|nr:MAG: DUF502 domain-containing protein [Nitrosomonas sp.]